MRRLLVQWIQNLISWHKDRSLHAHTHTRTDTHTRVCVSFLCIYRLHRFSRKEVQNLTRNFHRSTEWGMHRMVGTVRKTMCYIAKKRWDWSQWNLGLHPSVHSLSNFQEIPNLWSLLSSATICCNLATLNESQEY